MLKSKLFRFINNRKLSVPGLRSLHHEFSQPEPQKKLNQNQKSVEEKLVESVNAAQQVDHLSGALSNKYKIFREAESPEILDIFEERERYQSQEEPEDLEDDLYKGLNLKSKLTVLSLVAFC